MLVGEKQAAGHYHANLCDDSLANSGSRLIMDPGDPAGAESLRARPRVFGPCFNPGVEFVVFTVDISVRLI